MILVAGLPDETPTALVLQALRRIGADVRVFDQRRASRAALRLEVGDAATGGRIDGTLDTGRERLRLREIDAVFLRLADEDALPLSDAGGDREAARLHALRLHDLLRQAADLMPGRVLNRPAAGASNHSKPLQAHAIRAAGFDVPDTLITNDPAHARRFLEAAWDTGGAVVYKSISGVRSIVQQATPADLSRLDAIRWCPTQFQRRVPGVDLRVHVVGQRCFAAEIRSDAVDYRYAQRQVGRGADFAAVELDAPLRRRCVALAHRLELPLAGIDLRRTPDGRHVCFEVNPSPAFSYYEAHARLPIAAAIAEHLAGEAD